jgi:biotin operon repressor
MGRGASHHDATISLRQPRSQPGPPAWTDTIALGVPNPGPGGRRGLLVDLLRAAGGRPVSYEELAATTVSHGEAHRHFGSLTADGYLIEASGKGMRLISEPDQPADSRQVMLDALRRSGPDGLTFEQLEAAGVPRADASNGHWHSLTDEGYVLRLDRRVMTLLEDLDA